MLFEKNYSKLKRFKVTSFKSVERISKIYGVEKKNHVVVYCDLGKKNSTASPRLGKTFCDYFVSKGNKVSLFVDDYSTKLGFTPKPFNDLVLSLKKNDLLVLIGSGITPYFLKNGKRIDKDFLIKKKGLKIVSTNGLVSLKSNKLDTFFEAFNHNEKELISLNKKLVKLFKESKKVIITCPKGSDLSLVLGKRRIISNDGSLEDYSTNYPVGEVYTSPLENSANGVLFVKSVKVLGETFLLKQPKKMVFENGLLVNTNIPNLKNALKKLELFNKKNNVSNWKTCPYTIAEFAIGTNKKAKFVGLMINDEKIFGTVHVALGANSHFGGKTKCNGHMDYVVEKPTLFFDDKKIIDKGKFCF